jgi:tetratricopeptide (TPR) repeat protein
MMRISFGEIDLWSRIQTGFLVICFLFNVALPFNGYASDPDSLKKLLPAARGNNKIILLNQIAEAIVEEHPENAISYASESYQLAHRQNNLAEEAKALKLLADAAYYLNNFQDAAGYYQQSADVSEKQAGRESTEFLSRMGDIGFCYLKMNRYEKSLEYFTTALELSQKTGNLEEVAINNNNIGTIYAEWGDYGKAISYFRKAMDIDNQLGKKEVISTDLNNIGKLYESWGKYDQAIKYYNDALAIDQKAGNNKKIALRLNNLGLAHKALGKFREALGYFDKALEIERALGDMSKIGKRLYNIGITYFAMGQQETALTYFNQSLVIFQKMEMNDDLARLYNSFGNYYLQKNEFVPAIENLQKSQEIAVRNNLKPLQINNYQSLSVAYNKTGDYRQALKCFQDYASLKDSIFTSESDRKLAEFMARFDSEKINLENEMLRKNARLERRIYILTGISLIALLLVLTGIIFILRLRARNSRQAKEISEQRAEQYRKDLEIRNNELTYNAMCIIRNNETIARMVERVEAALNNGGSAEELQSILQQIRSMEHDNAWNDFEVRFTQIHSDFYERLNAVYPDLTPNEKKLCAFLRLNMTTKDIASITHQSTHGINVARTRLRKKMNLANSEENLVNFLMNF